MCQGSFKPSLFSSALSTLSLIAGLNLKSLRGSPDFKTIGLRGIFRGKFVPKLKEIISNDIPTMILGKYKDLLIYD